MISQQGRLSIIIVVSALCLSVAGCAMTRQKKAPRIAAAERHIFRGIAALEQHRFTVADTEFADAYDNYAAVEDFHGMVTVLVNRSRLYRKQGQVARAAAMIDLADGMVGHVPELVADVRFERGKIEFLRNNADVALIWAEKSLQVAEESNRAMITNFCAVIRLHKKELERAELLAETALKESRTGGDRHEEANALRTLAEIALARNSALSAETFYRDALAIDKGVADSAAIHDDLKGLAASSQLAGTRQAAADYLVRAAEVALAGGDTSAALEDYTAAATIREQSGDREGATAVVNIINRLRTGLKGSSRP